MLNFNITSFYSLFQVEHIPQNKRKEYRMLFKNVLLGIFVLFSVVGCSEQKLDSKPTINVWHWMTDRDPTFQELAKKYETLTGVKINFEL